MSAPIKTTAELSAALQQFANGDRTVADAIKGIRDKALVTYLAGHLQPVLMVLEENPQDAVAMSIINSAVQETSNVEHAIQAGAFKTLHKVFQKWPEGVAKGTINHVSVVAKCSVAEHSEMAMCEAGLHLDLLKECLLPGTTAQSAFQALGNIAFALPCKPVLLEAGAVQIAFQLHRTKLPSDPVYSKVFNFLRSMSLHPPALPLLIENGIIDVLKAKISPVTLGGELPKPEKDVFWFISNISDTKEGAMALIRAGFLPYMCKYLGDGQPKAEGTQEYHENIIKAFYRFAKVKEVHEQLLDGGVVDLLTSERKRSPNTALMAIALLVGKQDEGKYAGIINADQKILDSIISNMKSAVQNHLSGQAAFVKQPISVVDYFEAVQAISISDVNKAQFCNAATLDLIVDFIRQCSKDLPIVAAGMSVLLELTFAQAAVAHFNANKVRVLKALEEACAPHKSNASLTKTLADFKFRLEPEEKKKEQSIQRRLSKVGGPTSGATNDKVVFISYNWAHQKEIVRLATDIKAAGYKVWLDIDQMAGSTVEAMADGLDSASIVLVDISPQYKESANCRLEGMYAMQRRLPIVPIMFEARYQPTGWLGLLLGTSLWYPYTDESMHATVLTSVLRELTLKIGPAGAANSNPSSAPAAPAAAPPPPPSKPTVRDMTVKEVGEWLQKIGLEKYVPQFEDGAIDGAALAWIVRKDELGLDAVGLVHKLGIQVPGHAYRFLELARVLAK